MQVKHSPYADGAFLIRHTTPVHWIARRDGFRELKHSMRDLHHYTASEALQCLRGKHMAVIGDSLTRYQFMSLAWFLHLGHYPPHFGRPQSELRSECVHIDEHGNPTCSSSNGTLNYPNICIEGDWRFGSPKNGDV